MRKKMISRKISLKVIFWALFIFLIFVTSLIYKIYQHSQKPVFIKVKVLQQWSKKDGRALAVALDGSKLYISDTKNKEIDIFSIDGKPLAIWKGFENPNGICVDDWENIFVNDNAMGFVKKFNRNGKIIKKWKFGFYGQRGLVNGDKCIYITDTGNHRVCKFDLQGNLLKEWGKPGRGRDQLGEPIGITRDIDGFIYVAESRNHRIHKYSSDGSTVTLWSYSAGPDGGYAIEPYLTSDGQAHIILSDQHNGCLQVFSNAGHLLGITEKGAFDSPLGLAADKNNDIYVLDKNFRVQKVHLIYPVSTKVKSE